MALEYRLFDFTVRNISFEDIDDDDENNNSFKDDKQFEIEMFGINEKGETASITVTDYLPFFYISLLL